MPKDFCGQPEIRLEGRDAHYLNRVLRLARGHEFDARDAQGRLWRATLADQGPGFSVVRLSEAEEKDLGKGCVSVRLHLFQCLPKGAKMDLIVRQGVEAGLAGIHPLRSEFSSPSKNQEFEGGQARPERWRRIMREAAQQSGAREGTELFPEASIDGLGSLWGGGRLGLFFHERPLAESTLHRYLFPMPEELAILVGPEGGLSEAECQNLEGLGWRPAWLGPNVLRAETAAIYSIASVKTILLEHGAWEPTMPFRQSE